MKLGLRFRKGDARVLRNVAQECARHGLPVDIGLYDKAADAAEAGEPLQIQCEHPLEVEHIAAGFSHFGIRQPTIEELSG